MLENADTEKMKSTLQESRKRWRRRIKKEKEQVEKEVWHLSNQEFYSEEDALKAARERENGGDGETKKRRAYTDGLPRKSGVCGERFSLPKIPLVLCPYYGLKNEGRIAAMVMIMGLMVYSIAERKLREALEKAGETLPDQRGKPTQK